MNKEFNSSNSKNLKRGVSGDIILFLTINVCTISCSVLFAFFPFDVVNIYKFFNTRKDPSVNFVNSDM